MLGTQSFVEVHWLKTVQVKYEAEKTNENDSGNEIIITQK